MLLGRTLSVLVSFPGSGHLVMKYWLARRSFSSTSFLEGAFWACRAVVAIRARRKIARSKEAKEGFALLCSGLFLSHEDRKETEEHKRICFTSVVSGNPGTGLNV